MFFECSLYGTVTEINSIYSNEYDYKCYERIEHIYNRESNYIYIYEQQDEIFVIQYSAIDKNRQRKCLVMKIQKVKTDTSIFTFLEKNGFIKHTTRKTIITEFKINGYIVEFDSCLDNTNNLILVKAYCIVIEPTDGEKILSTVFRDIGIKMMFDINIFTKYL